MSEQKIEEIISNLQKARCTNALSVSVTKNPADEKSDQIYKIQEKFLTLSEDIKDKMVSPQTSDEIKKIGQSYDLTLLQLADISRAIRSYYFSELSKEDFINYLAKEIPTDMVKAQEITRAVFQRIINDNSQEIENQAKTEKLSLPAALQKYPEVGEQLVTSNRILLNRFPEPARPSIKNWIADYTFTMGFDPHDSAARGTYLFQNKNTRNLNRQDQNNLSHILRAFDTNESIEINTTLKQVIFPRLVMEKKPAPETPRRAFSDPIPSEPEKKPDYPTAPSPRKGSGLLQRAHSANFSPQKNSIVLKSTTTPAPSGTFIIARKNLPAPSDTAEKKLTDRPNNPILPSARKAFPTKINLQFTSPQKLPFEKRSTASIPTVPKEIPETKTPSPLKIIPRNFRGKDNANNFPLPKNVVNLKEK
ncbi:MAG: hypothetical protein WC022_01675 [Parcubacteria group bacterium]